MRLAPALAGILLAAAASACAVGPTPTPGPHSTGDSPVWRACGPDSGCVPKTAPPSCPGLTPDEPPIIGDCP